LLARPCPGATLHKNACTSKCMHMLACTARPAPSNLPSLDGCQDLHELTCQYTRPKMCIQEPHSWIHERMRAHTCTQSLPCCQPLNLSLSFMPAPTPTPNHPCQPVWMLMQPHPCHHAPILNTTHWVCATSSASLSMPHPSAPPTCLCLCHLSCANSRGHPFLRHHKLVLRYQQRVSFCATTHPFCATSSASHSAPPRTRSVPPAACIPWGPTPALPRPLPAAQADAVAPLCFGACKHAGTSAPERARVHVCICLCVSLCVHVRHCALRVCERVCVCVCVCVSQAHARVPVPAACEEQRHEHADKSKQKDPYALIRAQTLLQHKFVCNL